MRWRRPSRPIVLRSVGVPSTDVRYVTETSCTTMLNSSSATVYCCGRGSDTDCKLALPRYEVENPRDEEQRGPAGAGRQHARVRELLVVDHRAPGPDQRRHRVKPHEEPESALGRLLRRVEDRRRVEPDP